MTTRMPAPRMVAFAVKTGNALVDCGQHVVWMSDADCDAVAAAWRELAFEIRGRNLVIETFTEGGAS